MIQAKKLHFFFFFVSLVFFVSCEKDEVVPDILEEENLPNSVVPAYTFSAGDANGVFHALNAVTYKDVAIIGPQRINTNTAIAFFFSAPSTKPYVDAGSITCETKSLIKDTSSFYYYNPGGSDVMTYSGTTDWAISGNVSTAVPLFNYSTTTAMPDYNAILNGTLTSSVDRSAGLTISINGAVSNADSVLVTISSGTTYVKKTVSATGNCSFSSAELGVLSSSNGQASGIIQVAPYKIESTLLGGKKFYFVNQASFTKMVTVN